MSKYIGLKIVDAEPAVEGGFEKAGQHGGVIARDGYNVIYQDGKLWYPKEVFEKEFRPIEGLSFGEVIEALKQGKRVCRTGWNGKGMFIFMRPADDIHISVVAKNIKSLPKSVRDFYYQDCIDDEGKEIVEFDANDKVLFTAYLCLKDAQGCVVNGWLASQTDILAEDWEILD
ncbi:MAG: DUF2829 domain-containing protein [Bacteroidota bacterium]